MKTEEIASKFYDYMQKNDYKKIYSELYSTEATSEEPPGSDWKKARGMKEIEEKGKKWNEIIESMHGGNCEKPVVAGDYFAVRMSMDFTPKGGERKKMNELGVYHVKDGKIVSEQFFS
jgi:hypothetical protein